MRLEAGQWLRTEAKEVLQLTASGNGTQILGLCLWTKYTLTWDHTGHLAQSVDLRRDLLHVPFTYGSVSEQGRYTCKKIRNFNFRYGSFGALKVYTVQLWISLSICLVRGLHSPRTFWQKSLALYNNYANVAQSATRRTSILRTREFNKKFFLKMNFPVPKIFK